MARGLLQGVSLSFRRSEPRGAVRKGGREEPKWEPPGGERQEWRRRVGRVTVKSY